MKTSKRDVALGSVVEQLFDYESRIRQGRIAHNLHPMLAASPLASTASYVDDPRAPAGKLHIEYDTYEKPVIGPTTGCYFFPNQGQLDMGVETEPSTVDKQKIDMIIKKDPLYRLEKDEKDLFWRYRGWLKTNPKALPKFLQSVPWHIAKSRAECHLILEQWAKLEAVDALEILDGKFPDQKVREFALECLEAIDDTDLADFVLPLCQVIKYEAYHDSALANWMLKRAVKSSYIGHMFFWNLKAELHLETMRDRYGALVATYLFCCGPYRYSLYKQNLVLTQLDDIANHIKTIPSEKRLQVLRDALKEVEFPERFQLPLDPRMECCGLNVEKCRYMDSKKLPLWLNFKNVDPDADSIIVIYKAGDDLRQDYLTLQLITLMDRLWQDNGINMCMKPYKCVPTGDEQGMLQVVVNSDTISNIQKKAGGAMGAFKADPVANWLDENRPAEVSKEEQLHNFIYSCAGYCVATYVLGIGDRHNDNIMVTKAGNFFHIDFGHFLGNIKKKFGIKRERAPFVFTPDLAFVMGGKESPNFQKFVDLTCQAYNILRHNANMFITMFSMMISSGMPELTKEEDIQYLQEAFALELTDAEAADKMKKLIAEALDSTATKLNFAIHIMAH
jgi:phosphatidylinositol-4,5-bisphosphate 3-kinase